MPGYSGTPLATKLGIKTGFRIKTKNAPANYQKLLNPVPSEVSFSTKFRSEVDLWHLFTSSRKELSQQLAIALKQMRQNGMIWVSGPKKSSGMPSEVTEDTVREIALPMGLVDVKVCAVDDTWSGLKLMIRKKFQTNQASTMQTFSVVHLCCSVHRLILRIVLLFIVWTIAKSHIEYLMQVDPLRGSAYISGSTFRGAVETKQFI